MRVRKLAPPDRDGLTAIFRADDTFRADEVAVAMELIDSALDKPEEGYRVLVCESDRAPQITGYICYGETPMTDGTYDLYWIVAHPETRGRGVGGKLISAMEEELLAAKARLVRIETSQLEGYDAARTFYSRRGYHEVGRIIDFYREGDDLITLSKRLGAAT